MAAWGSAMVMVGARRGGLAGGLTAALGTTLAVRAAMGRHDLHVARRLFDRALSDRGWGAKDIVADAERGIVPGERLPVLDGRLRRDPRALTAELGDTQLWDVPASYEFEARL